MKYLTKKSSKWMFRFVLLVLLTGLIISCVELWDSIKEDNEVSITGVVIFGVLITLFTKLNGVSYDKSNIHIVNFRGTFIYPKNDLMKVTYVVNGVSLFMLSFKSDKRQYLFYFGNINLLGSFNSRQVANEIMNEIFQE